MKTTYKAIFQAIFKDLRKWIGWFTQEPNIVYLIKMSVPANAWEVIKAELKQRKYKAVCLQLQFMDKEIGNIVSYDYYLIKELKGIVPVDLTKS